MCVGFILLTQLATGKFLLLLLLPNLVQVRQRDCWPNLDLQQSIKRAAVGACACRGACRFNDFVCRVNDKNLLDLTSVPSIKQGVDGIDPTLGLHWQQEKRATSLALLFLTPSALSFYIYILVGPWVLVCRSVSDLTIGLWKGGEEETTMFPSLPLKTAHTQSARFCLLFCFHRPVYSRVFRLFFYRLNNSNLTDSLYVCVYTTVIDCFKVILFFQWGWKLWRLWGFFFSSSS